MSSPQSGAIGCDRLCYRQNLFADRCQLCCDAVSDFLCGCSGTVMRKFVCSYRGLTGRQL
ncbi:hypothetical protein H6S82_29615 [Planktothrix sp. FACHB-1355]|uniref:Uncharacterized protein n=1 Tax=Aerosakkonema funiforme FACHB-1375 TaxID=2949571 RepID=A0A926VCD8_9CYAN|nr:MULTISPECIES: hypothetical protein [Oscillatoriales]MBD2181213.1 hypothetical protein [Aerosakkonema funiforme FACHB-1375]MBD3562969.1 hypothetical protein [Planktothrix sp. FACHB-1355]